VYLLGGLKASDYQGLVDLNWRMDTRLHRITSGLQEGG